MKNNFELGQGFLEYALIIVVVAILLIVLLEAFGVELSGIYNNIRTTLDF